MSRILILWKILLAVTASLVLWFIVLLAPELWKYCKLTTRGSAQISSWEIKPLSSSYGLQGHYRYQIDGREYAGKTLLKSPVHLNVFAAQNAIKSMPMNVIMWYQKSNN